MSSSNQEPNNNQQTPLPLAGDVLPIAYNSDLRIVIFDSPCMLPPAPFASLPEREGWTRGTMDATFYVKKAIANYKKYNDKQGLLWAIENNLPEVYESKEGREVFAALVTRFALTQRGQRKEQALRVDKDIQNAFRLVWYYIGQGYPVIANSENSRNTDTACSLAGRDIGKSPQRVHKIYMDLGGDSPAGALRIIADIARTTSIKPSTLK